MVKERTLQARTYSCFLRLITAQFCLVDATAFSVSLQRRSIFLPGYVFWYVHFYILKCFYLGYKIFGNSTCFGSHCLSMIFSCNKKGSLHHLVFLKIENSNPYYTVLAIRITNNTFFSNKLLWQKFVLKQSVMVE